MDNVAQVLKSGVDSFVVGSAIFKNDNPRKAAKEFKNLLSSLGLADKKSLFVLGESNNNVYLSSRNLKRSKVVTSSEISTYAVMNANSIVLFEGTVEGVVSNLSK